MTNVLKGYYHLVNMDEDNYSALRERNISERNAFFAKLEKDIENQTKGIKKLRNKRHSENESKNQLPRKRRRISLNNLENSNMVHQKFQKRYTRNKQKTFNIDEWCVNSEQDNMPKLKILFRSMRKRNVDLIKVDISDVDEEKEDDTTNEILSKVAERSSSKIYSRNKGTTCHQCRHKTLDIKTVCKSGKCIGNRGHFCGPCLRIRYGESAIDALKDANWACPSCRGLCNCSRCRISKGLQPTGILAPIIQKKGFSSAMDYLQAIENNDNVMDVI